MYAELSPVLLSLEMFIVTSSANLTSNAVPLIRVRPPPGFTDSAIYQFRPGGDGEGRAVDEDFMCAHVGPPLCCKGVGAVGVLNHGEGAGEGKGGADAVPVSTVLFGDIPGGIQHVHVCT